MKFLHLLAIVGLSVFLASFSYLPGRVPHSILGRADTSFPSFINALDYRGKTIISTNGITLFSSGTDNDLYPRDKTSRHCYFYLETAIKTNKVDSVKRLPLNLSIVIDRSGSMKGEKMDRAIEAAKNIVDQLGETDIVSIIAYGDEVDIVQPAIAAADKEKERIKEKINLIMPRGGTNLWGGCETGYYQVLKNSKPGYINHVFLITDGLANVGLTSAKGIKANVQRFKDDEGITLSGFGVGLDFNEVLLNDMAEAGSGNYYFIDEPGKITGMLQTELNSLMHITIREAVLTLQLPEGVKVEKLYPYTSFVNGKEIIIKFRNLKDGEVKPVLLNLKIADSTRSPLAFRSVLSYTEVRTGQKKLLENHNKLEPAPYNQYLAFYNREVIGKVLVYAMGENLEAVMTEVDKDNFAGAAKVYDQNGRLLDNHRKYVNDLAALQKMDSASYQYGQYLPGMKSMGRDSLRLIQKTSRSYLYGIMNGK
jgi:Ca-activated chloride channel family protein